MVYTGCGVNGLAGVIGVLAIALCGFELGGWWGAYLAAFVVVSLALLFPFGMLIVLKPALYDAMRQFLFLVPPLVLLGAYGFINLVNHLICKKNGLAVIGLLLVVLLTQLQVVKDMHDIHPYEYMYFSPLIGGVRGANGRFEMDYWGICNKPAAEWLAHNYRKYTAQQFPTIDTSFNPDQATVYLPKRFGVDGNEPDFYIAMTRFNLKEEFPSYRIIHTEVVQGYIACVVKAKP